MRARQNMLITIAALLLIIVLAAGWLALRGGIIGTAGSGNAPVVQVTNLALDVRFSYDPVILTPAEFDGRAEYPLRLDGDGWSFYGKRIGGMGRMLAKEPGALLYDFVGSQHMDTYEQWYKLEPLDAPVYEDAYIGGKLALHQQVAYRRTETSLGWPSYFPQTITDKGTAPIASMKEVRSGAHIQDRLTADTGVTTAYIEGWALFTAEDLFFFQAISTAQLTDAQRAACLSIMESLQFNALLSPPAPAPAPVENQTTPEQPEEPAGEQPE